MFPKKFFRTLNRAKCAKYVSAISGLFLFFTLFFVTGTVSAQETAPQLSAADELDYTVRDILQRSIRTIRESASYSTYLNCQAKIKGKTFNGSGEFRQKRQKRESVFQGAEEIVSARWEITFYLPDFNFYQLSVLNGNLKSLWTLAERRTAEQKAPNEKNGEIQYVNLASVRAAIETSPLEYTSLTHPWYSQPNVAQILEGILKSFQFTMGAETHFSGTDQPIYMIKGKLKPELMNEILEARDKKSKAGISELPGEVPTDVELLMDKIQELPIQIRFWRAQSDEKESETPEETFSYTILFEQSHLNNVSLDDSFFEISRGYQMHDVTEQYLKDHHN